MSRRCVASSSKWESATATESRWRLRGLLESHRALTRCVATHLLLASTSSLSFSGMMRYMLGSIELVARPWVIERRVVV